MYRMQNRRVLITGDDGFIGSNLAEVFIPLSAKLTDKYKMM
jgi:FlaA1/EpsC-like NDP-sugar epimerase